MIDSDQPLPKKAFTPPAGDLSCRIPVLALFSGGAIWLCVSSILGLMASIKFHQPAFLADCAWLTYGRVFPASTAALLYGFCIPAGLAVALWLFVRLGRVQLAHGPVISAGALFWNLGVLCGVLGILAGDSTGFENFELPHYAAPICFASYVMIGLCGLITFHRRAERTLFVSQWFLFAALFWFAWIFSTAYLLLITFPVRGITQAVIDWWYAQNLLVVWLGLVGLGAIFYFVPKLAQSDLYSHHLGLLTFWLLILFGGWGGIPGSAPVPAWIPVLSTVTTGLMFVPLVTAALNVFYTAKAGGAKDATPAPFSAQSSVVMRFVLFATAAFVAAGVMRIGAAVLDTGQVLHFTWFGRAERTLNSYGFFAMAMFGAGYYILPRILGTELPFPKLARWHFWLAALGIVLSAGVWAVGGGVEEVHFLKGGQGFMQVVKSTLPFLRASTTGDLLILVGHVLFLVNLAGLLARVYRARAQAAYAAATADLFKVAEAKS